MKLNLEDERRELAECLKLRETLNEPIWGEVEARRKLVHALEQLEQAREALKRISETETDWRQSLDANMEGVRTVACQALKQQEVGNE